MSEAAPAERPKADRPPKGAGCFLFVIILIALVGGLVGWCGGPVYPNYTYRFRVTVEVDVADNVKSAASVIEVRNTKQARFLHAFGGLSSTSSGDAVFLDLGDGRNVVATLAFGFEDQSLNVTWLVPTLFGIPMHDDVLDASLPRLQQLRGSRELTGKSMPPLVTFSNPVDPGSFQVVDIKDFERVFGPGVRFKRAFIEMTTDPVTRGIEQKLPWLTRMKAQGLDGSATGYPGRFSINVPYFTR